MKTFSSLGSFRVDRATRPIWWATCPPTRPTVAYSDPNSTRPPMVRSPSGQSRQSCQIPNPHRIVTPFGKRTGSTSAIGNQHAKTERVLSPKSWTRHSHVPRPADRIGSKARFAPAPQSRDCVGSPTLCTWHSHVPQSGDCMGSKPRLAHLGPASRWLRVFKRI